ncbi:MAG: 3-hydroxybutyryl-CoA dehydrogenase [Frankiales bacterium]|nr:3-hydroxybutyryl-CoA dehydrogenase [Frankiales bacterium]
MRVPAGSAVGVVGAGTMGAGIAQVAALAGHLVLLLDAAPGQALESVERVRARMGRLAEQHRIDGSLASAACANLSAAGAVTDLAGCRLVIEAVAEVLDVKRDVFRALENVVSDDCVLATNTSSLSIAAIAKTLRRPQRLVGMHFFNPPTAMELIEVVSGPATDPQLASLVADVATAWGKTPVRVSSTPGFVVNRVARPFYGEGLRALEERAADPATIDAVLREAGGFRMGPLELTDLIGQDVNLAVTRSVWERLGKDPRFAPSTAQQALVDAGRLGRKTGRGFYRYGDDAQPAVPVSAAPAPAPRQVTVAGDWGPWTGLWARLGRAGVEVQHDDTRDSEVPFAELAGGGLLVPSDGRTATERARLARAPVVVVDLAFDPLEATRFAIAAADGSPSAATSQAVGLLQASGAAVSVIDDLPGLLVARTVAMLVNQAVDCVALGVASAADVDTAMRLGAAYPIGPLQWGDRLGAGRVTAILDALDRAYPGGRYRVCPALRRSTLLGRSLREI